MYGVTGTFKCSWTSNQVRDVIGSLGWECLLFMIHQPTRISISTVCTTDFIFIIIDILHTYVSCSQVLKLYKNVLPTFLDASARHIRKSMHMLLCIYWLGIELGEIINWLHMYVTRYVRMYVRTLDACLQCMFRVKVCKLSYAENDGMGKGWCYDLSSPWSYTPLLLSMFFYCSIEGNQMGQDWMVIIYPYSCWQMVAAEINRQRKQKQGIPFVICSWDIDM